jgi:hypothetical protein
MPCFPLVGGWWARMSREDFFFCGHPNKRRWPARCVKHPPHRPWGYLRIERFHGARLVSGSSEPKAVNACTKTSFPSPWFNFLSPSSKQLSHKPFIVPQLWIIETCVLHEKDAPRRGESILTIRFEFRLL